MSDSLSSVLKRCLDMIESTTFGDRLFDGELHISTLGGGLVAVIDDNRGDITSLVNSDGEEDEPEVPTESEALEKKEAPQKVSGVRNTLKRKREAEDDGRPGSWGLCPVCWDTPAEMQKAGKVMLAAKCGHLLCNHCMRSVLKSSLSRCPQCRNIIREKFIRCIYC